MPAPYDLKLKARGVRALLISEDRICGALKVHHPLTCRPTLFVLNNPFAPTPQEILACFDAVMVRAIPMSAPIPTENQIPSHPSTSNNPCTAQNGPRFQQEVPFYTANLIRRLKQLLVSERGGSRRIDVWFGYPPEVNLNLTNI